MQAVISTYFPSNNFKTVSSNVVGSVLLNSTSGTLSYLTITGNFVADVPIQVPSQLILVMLNATLQTKYQLFSSAANTPLLQSRGNALINFKSANFAGVVSPHGSYGILSCTDYPAGSNLSPNNFNYPSVPSPSGSLSATGPDGVAAIGSNNLIIDGISVQSCGMTSANIALFNTKVVEVSNNVMVGGGVRGLWIILASTTAVQFNYITTSVKFAIDLDASSGPWSLIHSNKIVNNGFQGVFIEQGTQFSVVSNNFLSGNQNGVSFFNNIYPQLVINHVILNNIMTGSWSAGLNVGSISCQCKSR